MNSLEIHLIINHIPIFSALFGAALLIYGALTKNKQLLNFGILILIIGAALIIPVFISGEGSESLLHKSESISLEALHSHEEIAEIALYMYISLGILALLAFFLNYKKNKNLDKLSVHFSVWIVIILSIAVTAVTIYTGNKGGEIRRPEIRMKNSFNPNIDTTTTKELINSSSGQENY